MNNSSSAGGVEILPTVNYPPSIRGSLRLILQLKDAFLGCFNLVEEYRDQLLACKHGFTRELVVYQLSKGLTGIERLREDYSYVEAQAQRRANRNTLLRKYILERYDKPGAKDKSGAPVGIISRMGHEGSGEGAAQNVNIIPPPISAPNPVEQALHGGLDHYSGVIDVDNLNVPEEINLATTVTESGAHLKPVVEFYRALYFLQMHFQLIMCQAANYALPVVTRPMSVSERAFAWPAMPCYGIASKSGAMKDRLLEIHSDVLNLASKLHECLALVREKLHQDKRIENYFLRHTAAQETLRGNLLRGIQAQRVYIESLERQNDRLAGLAIKLDPSFAKSTNFAMMTGPGIGLPDGNQNSALTGSQFDIRRRDDRPDRDPSGGGHPGATRQRRSSSTNVPNDKHRKQDHSEERRDHYRVNDTNFSATGNGRAAIWQSRHVNPNKTYDAPDDVELNKKLNQMRGHAHAVEELLIGVDSIASGFGRFTEDIDPGATPDFLNTEQYITSMCDEVFGHVLNTKSNKKSSRSVPTGRLPNDGRSACTASTTYTEAELLSPNLSYKQSGSTVSSDQINGPPDGASKCHMTQNRLKDDAVIIHHHENNRRLNENDRNERVQSQNSQTVDSVDNTTSEDIPSTKYLDTNVNSSHVNLPKLPPTSRHPLNRFARTAHSSPPTKRDQRSSEFPHIPKTPSSKESEDNYDTGLVHAADESHLRQVPMVGSTECGHLCAPDWISNRGVTKIHKSEDLLQEPKRSALNKAVFAHRCRLVETILQADEDRLEEIISLLIRE